MFKYPIPDIYQKYNSIFKTASANIDSSFNASNAAILARTKDGSYEEFGTFSNITLRNE